MRAGVEALAELIRAEHTTWEDPIVCRRVFGTDAPDAIALTVSRLCEDELGSGVAGARFYAVSVGCVAGVELEDGRAVVLKVQRASRPLAYFAACHRVRRHLAAAGFPCPAPVGEPTSLGSGALVTCEELDARGEWRDAHDPEVRGVMTATLAELVGLARGFASDPAFSGAWFTTIPEGRTYPRPHSPLFDFDRTAEGAGWIDALAGRARARRHQGKGDLVVGHFDWRVEHLRFSGGRVVTSYDWDSLHAELETVLVGAAAHAFTADWQRDDVVRVPSGEELALFVEDYERARGVPFDAAERATVRASCVYSLCYTARCNHAVNPTEEGWNGDFRPLLRAHGERLLDAG